MLAQYIGKVVLNKDITKKDGKLRRVLAIASTAGYQGPKQPEVAYITLTNANGVKWHSVKEGDDCSINVWRYRVEVRIVRDGKPYVIYDGIYSD